MRSCASNVPLLAPPNAKTQHSGSVSDTFHWLTFKSIPQQNGPLRINSIHVLVYENVIELIRSGTIDSFALRPHRGKHGLHHTGRHIQSKPQPCEAVPFTTKYHSLVGPQGFVDSYMQVLSAKVNDRHVKGTLYIMWCGVNRLGDSGVKVV